MADNIDVFLKKNILSHGSGHGQRLSGRKHNPIENLGSQSRQSKVMELLSVSGIDNLDLDNGKLMVVQDEDDPHAVDVTEMVRDSPDARIEDIIAKAANIRPEFFKLPPMYLIYEYEIELSAASPAPEGGEDELQRRLSELSAPSPAPEGEEDELERWFREVQMGDSGVARVETPRARIINQSLEGGKIYKKKKSKHKHKKKSKRRKSKKKRRNKTKRR